MTTAEAFRSVIGPVIARYIDLKQSLGRRFESERYILAQFDRFLAEHQAPDLTPDTFSAWSRALEHLTASGRRGRMRIVYNFCLFRRRTEPEAFLPDPSQFPPPQPRPRPYIFTHAEIARLLEVTDGLRAGPQSPLYPEISRLSVVLLYTTGLRRGEAVRLNLGDYQASKRLLLVLETKFHKSRILPLSEDAAREMERYLEARDRPPFPRDAESPLLLTNLGGAPAYSHGGFGKMVRRHLRAAGIRTAAGRTPRVHDLRFTFAVHALLRWYRAGIDVQTRLPALSTYMGHVSIVSTQYYLVFLDAVMEAANDRFERHCADFFPAAVPTGGAL